MSKVQMISEPYPGLGEIITLIGEAGSRLAEIGASEGAAGNISVFIGWPTDPRRRFPIEEEIVLPVSVPLLAGALFLVTGSGRRLREIGNDPEANIGAVVINPDGNSAKLYTSHRRLFARLTSEFNSHLALHQQQVAKGDCNFHAVIHAQPVHLTFLTHLPQYQDEKYLNQHILRWQPELIVNLPSGVALLPFAIPGSEKLMQGTMNAMDTHNVVVWGKHGIVSRSHTSVKKACDLIEYADTGAHYEYMNLAAGEKAEGLTAEEIISVCQTFSIDQKVF